MRQTNKQLQEKAALDSPFQAIKTEQDPINCLMILKKICFSNQSEQHPIYLLFLYMRRLYNTIYYANKNTTKYLVTFWNAQRFNEDLNGSLITKSVQEHGMKILFPLQNTVFDSLQ